MNDKNTKILAVGGGKGGIGKSLVAANLGVTLALGGKKVIIVDADMGGENLHLLFGIRYPETTMSDFVSKKVAKLSEVLIPTCVNNLRLIAGGSDIINLANPHYQQKQKLLRNIKSLEADYVLVDLGAGTSHNVIDFYNISNEGIVVVTPEPTSIQNVYLFLKNVVYRKLTRAFSNNKEVMNCIAAYGKDSTNRNMVGLFKQLGGITPEIGEQAADIVAMLKPRIILNMFRKEQDAKFVESLKKVSQGFLSLSLEFLGHLAYDMEVRQSIGNMVPFTFSGNAARPTRQMKNIALKLGNAFMDVQKLASNDTGLAGKTKILRGYNDNVDHNGILFHVQTEVFLRDKHLIITVVYRNGEILFTKKQPFNKDSAEKDEVLRQHYGIIKGIRAGKLNMQPAGT